MSDNIAIHAGGGPAIRKIAVYLLVFLLTGSLPVTAQDSGVRPETGPGTVKECPASPPSKDAPKKSKAGASPKQQIKEGGREIGQGFKDLGVGIGRGFQNMGRAIKKAWSGD